MKSGWLYLLLAFASCHRGSESTPTFSNKATPNEAPPSKPLQVPVTAACADLAECEQKCSAGRAPACIEAGRLLEFGHKVEFRRDGAADPAKAYSYYDRACNLGSATGCYNQAILLEAGKGVAKDEARALGLYRRVCRMGSKTACARAEQLEQPGGSTRP